MNIVDIEDEETLARFLSALLTEGRRFRVEHTAPHCFRVWVS